MAKKKTTKKKTAKKKTDLATQEYNPDEQKLLDDYCKKTENNPLKVEFSENSTDGDFAMQPVDPNSPLLGPKLLEATGTADLGLSSHFLKQASLCFSRVSSSGGLDKNKFLESYNNSLAILNGIHPQDEVEAMLAVQMIGVHNMAMETLSVAMIEGQSLEGKQANINFCTKLQRTFIAQMEALKKHRTEAQQTVRVEHVHVNEGGQAIVGNVTHAPEGGGGKDKSDG